MGALNLRVERYASDFDTKWDRFIMEESCNGTFLQTRRFLSYHPQDRFQDTSLIIWKGTQDIVAVIPACSQMDERGRVFNSHPGSTFGGFVFNSRYYDILHVESAVDALDDWLIEQGYSRAILKQSSQLYSSCSNDLLDYILFNRGYECGKELCCVINLSSLEDDVVSGFDRQRRKAYRKAVSEGLILKKIDSREGIACFYDILSGNLMGKYGAKPVHTLEDLYLLNDDILKDEVEFYGAYREGEMVSGSMVFKFGSDVFHTQYTHARPDKLAFRPNDFVNASLIEIAKARGFKWFSFGSSTENKGRYLNESLARFKEGFGSTYCNNATYNKEMPN